MRKAGLCHARAIVQHARKTRRLRRFRPHEPSDGPRQHHTSESTHGIIQPAARFFALFFMFFGRNLRRRCFRGCGRAADRFQRERQIFRGLETLLGFFLQAAPHDALERGRHRTRHLVELRRIFFQDCGHGFGGGIPAKRTLARDHFVEHRPVGKNVRARINGCAAHLLRRHVPGRAHHRAGFGGHILCGCHGGHRRVGRSRAVPAAIGRELRQAEIQNFHAPLARDEYILRLQIAMHDIFFVRGGESLRHLHGIVHRLARRKPSLRQLRAQAAAFQKFGNDVGRAVLLADVVDAKNVRMVQRGDGFGFLLEAPQTVPVLGQRAGQNFDRDFATEARVLRAIDFAHPARADGDLNFVWP